jgi:hypothetical protein
MVLQSKLSAKHDGEGLDSIGSARGRVWALSWRIFELCARYPEHVFGSFANVGHYILPRV